MIKVFMGICSTGTRSDHQCYMLREMEKRYKDKIEFVYPEKCVFRMFHDFARNEMVEEFKKSDCDLLWFLDADVVPPSNIMDMVLDNYDDFKVAGAPYPIFMCAPGTNIPIIFYTVYNNVEDRLYPIPVLPESGLEYVDAVATGCLFIKREVIDKLEKPYFEFKYETENRHITEGEDLGFARKVTALGFKFLVDYSMLCDHHKNVSLLQINNYCIESTNYKVLEFQKQFKQELAKKMFEKETKSSIEIPKLILP